MTTTPNNSREVPADVKPRVIGKELAAKYPGAQLWLGGSADTYVTIDNIEIPKEMRNSGVGRQLMTDLIAVADDLGWALALSPSNSFGSSLPRLKKFYQSFGFVNNSGRNKDYVTRETMLRPKSK